MLKMKNRHVYACLAALFAVAAIYQVRVSTELVQNLLQGTELPRSPFEIAAADPIIFNVRVEAKNAGVSNGDRLISVNGRPFTGDSLFWRPIRRARAGDLLALRIQQKGSVERDVAVRLAPRRNNPPDIREWLLSIVSSLVMPAFCLLLGFWVAVVRPFDRSAWLLLALMLSFGQLFPVNLYGWPAGLREIAIAYHYFFANTWAIWMLLFGLYFPERLVHDRRWPWLKWILIAPLLAFLAVGIVIAVGSAGARDLVVPLRRLIEPYQMIQVVIGMISIGTFFASMGIKSGTADNPDSRRRLRLLLIGSQIGLTPMFLVVLWSLWQGKGVLEGVPDLVAIPALLLLFLFPLTLAYVIVVQRALDVRVVIRQGVQYALARNGVVVLQIMLSAAIIFAAASMVISSSGNRPQKMMFITAGITLVFLIRLMAGRLKEWTDRRFFREAYNAEQILSDLSEQVRTMVETRPLLETVARRIAESLHVPRVALLTNNDGAYRPAYALGYAGAPQVSFSQSAATVNQLRQANAPVRVYFDDPNSWVYRAPVLQDGERAMLEQLETQLLLPLAVKEKLPGFISLGPKQSEEPYSRTDLRLLQSVATQAGLALENSQLTAAIASEIAQRERLNRELEIAREVQERLLPQELPLVPGLDFAGLCRPALGVGGDYYDFLALPNGQFGIAIGDVSGKGIAAALLMASLQASLRGQTINGGDDLAAMMRNINHLIFESSLQSKYATFFYGQYEPSARRLVYVNAGHNAPMLFRREGNSWHITRLDIGGVVVGLFPDFQYQQATFTLQPGDQLVAFTDGISEAMNLAEEEWGEDRLIEAAQSCDGSVAAETIARVMRVVDAFTAGAPQHDDMTLVVVRMTNTDPSEPRP